MPIESDRRACESVKVRRIDVGIPVGSQMVATERVRDNDHNVGSGRHILPPALDVDLSVTDAEIAAVRVDQPDTGCLPIDPSRQKPRKTTTTTDSET